MRSLSIKSYIEPNNGHISNMSEIVLRNDFVNVLEKVKSYHCTFSVYVQYITMLIKRYDTVDLDKQIYIDMSLRMNDLLDEVDELEDLMNDQMVESKDKVQEYIDCVTILEYLNDLAEWGSAFINFLNGNIR